MRLALLPAVLFPLFLSAPKAHADTLIVLRKPIGCAMGQTCLIQQYVDHDPGPGAVDYRCGIASYDHHDGTDFRIPDKVAQGRGVNVLAAADGVVRAVRDGQSDFAVGAFNAAKVKGIECGNGVVIDHGDGWQTQYCHMRQGSVRVKPGDRVTAGTALGLVGQSGDAAFPHLHLTVRLNGQAVDPFAFGGATCGTGQSLWRQEDRAELAYGDTQVLNAGFATAAVPADDVERGMIAAPDRRSRALTLYVRAINLREGDVQSLSLKGPDGLLAQTQSPPLDHSKAQYQLFVGKKLGAVQWPAGTYTGTYTVTRDDKTVVTKTITTVLK